MSLATLKVVMDVQYKKRSRTEKKGFLSKEIIFGPPPVEIYIEMTTFPSEDTVKHMLMKDLPKQTSYTDRDVDGVIYTYYLDQSKVEQAKIEAMKFLSELSNQGWKVRQASDKIAAYLDKIKHPLNNPSSIQTTGSITISTIDEP